jgi:hypothetical protein
MMQLMFNADRTWRVKLSRTSLVGAALVSVLLVAMGLRLWVVLTRPSLPWPDEIFQTMEQAHRLVFGYGVIPWEFRVGARSWLFPGLVAGVMQLGRLFSEQGYLRSVQIAMTCLSLVPVAVAFSWANRRYGAFAAIAASLAVATWFELIYFSARTLTEVAATHVVIAALYMSSAQQLRQRRLLFCGIAFGIAAVLRFHLIPAIGACGALLCGRSLMRCRAMLIGIAVPVIGAGLLDLVTWSGFLSSFVSNFRYNIIEGQSTGHGVEPGFDVACQRYDDGYGSTRCGQ